MPPTPPARGSLPPSLQVPPIPQKVHKHLFLRATPHGLILSPHPRTLVPSASSSPAPPTKGALFVRWGREGKVVKLDEAAGGPGASAGAAASAGGTALGDDAAQQQQGVELEVRGLLGLVRLWSTAYLLVIIYPKDIGPLPGAQPTIFNLPSASIQAIPLDHSAAPAALERIAGLIAARAQASSDDETDSDDDGDGDEEDGSDWHRSGEVQTPAVEALMDALEQDGEGAASKGQKGFFPWNPFAPKPRDESAAPTTASAGEGDAAAVSDPPASKRASLKWNPFAPKPKADAVPSLAGLPADSPADQPQPTPPTLPLLPPTAPAAPARSSSPSAPAVSDARLQLERKIVHSLCALFSSGQFFFSYELDITRSPLAAAQAVGGGAGLPLWRKVKREFWWNEWLSNDFAEVGAHSFVLPVMQGYVQTRHVQLPAKVVDGAPPATDGGEEIEIAVVSRRSRDRAGLRYQRRGIDDDGHVANFVESEQIVKTPASTFSFLQIRGSIPLFWSQSPYSASSQLSLKPAPTLDRPLPAALAPMSLHFDHLVKTYGSQTVVSLSEVAGKEGAVTNGYREVLADLGKDGVEWREFDFHHECQGMKFENVSKLVSQMDNIFTAQGYGEVKDGAPVKKQQGTFRTNCIDCLDRTNVVQSAFARHVLGLQLASAGLSQAPSVGARTELETVFNDIWANNGDAISRSYAGTSALKGDFTRTGKRDWHGMLNDGLNSVARMYSSSFSDFWSQAVIDYMLGHRGLTMFTSEYMAKMSTAEPTNLLRLSIIRTEAIETCTSRVLEDGESRLAGWTLFSPREMNTTTGAEFEEKVLLLTKKAAYVCSFDFNLEKVVGFTRIALGNIDRIQMGAYILSPLQEAGQDAEENYGFKLFFRSSDDDTRLTSYTVRNERHATGATPTSSPVKATATRPSLPSSASSGSLSGGLRPLVLSSAKPLPPVEDVVNYFAFKGISRDLLLRRRGLSGGDRAPATGDAAAAAVHEDNDHDDGLQTCKELIGGIVTRIKLQCSEAGSGWDVGDKRFVVNDDVRSLSEAERETSWSSRIEYGIKRFLWL